MKSLFTPLLLLFVFSLSAQTVDFEQLNLSSETVLNGSDLNGGFTVGNIFLSNDYNASFDSWSGWAISNTTDATTQSYLNNSAITGSGSSGSATYAISYAYAGSVMNFVDLDPGVAIEKLSITNSTYAYLDMLNGDNSGYDISKKFGGVTGDDPDFLLLTIQGYQGGVLTTENVEFYLADCRFSDNDQDYIVDEWTEIDLTPLGEVDSLFFSLTSSDVGAFGMNTPAYFCVDDVVFSSATSSEKVVLNNTFTMSPNPVDDFLRIKNAAADATCFIYDMNGKLVYSTIVSEQAIIDVRSLVSGTYVVKVVGEKGIGTELLSVF